MVGAKLLHSSLALLTLRSRALSAFALPLLHTLRSSFFSSLFLTHSATAVRDVWLKKVALKVQLPGPGLDIDYAPLSFSPLPSSPLLLRAPCHALSHCICIIYVLAAGGYVDCDSDCGVECFLCLLHFHFACVA